jgi:hypothetical protein
VNGKFRNLTHLVALTPTTVVSLLADQKLTRSSRAGTCFVGLSDKGKALQCKLSGVGETDAPTTDPTTFRLLCIVKVDDRVPDGAAGDGSTIPIQ